jgi:hypothetical protein
MELKSGKVIENWSSNAWLRSTSKDDDGVPDDVLCEHLGLPVFSGRLCEAIRKQGVATTDIQFLPVKLIASTGEFIDRFAIANVIRRVPALDYKLSIMLEQDDTEYDPLTGKAKVTSVWTPVLLENLLIGYDVVRLVEFFPPIFVSQRFAEVFIDGGFTGAVLEPIRSV